jgi:hypothetical protein
MIRRLVPAVLSTMLLGPLLSVTGAVAEDIPAAAGSEEQGAAGRAPAPRNETPARTNDGRILVTRSDGSTVHTKAPDPKDIRKLVSYMRDGMARADRAEKQRTTKRVIQYRPARGRK